MLSVDLLKGFASPDSILWSAANPPLFSAPPTPHVHCHRLNSVCCTILKTKQKQTKLIGSLDRDSWCWKVPHLGLPCWPGMPLNGPGQDSQSNSASSGGIHFPQHNFRRIHSRVYRIPSLIQVVLKWLERF